MRRCPRQGFTLLEILVAMTVLSVGIVGVLGTFTLSLRTGLQASRIGQATEIAQRQMELASAGLDAALDQTGSKGAYTWQMKQTDLPEGLKVVSVAVNWLERGRTQTFTLSQIVVANDRELGE